jgi:hypothetical protein
MTSPYQVAADLGPILPLHPDTRRPLVPFAQASADPERIASWLDRWPAMGVGVHAGLSSLVVIDVDAKPGKLPGRPTLDRYEAALGPLPRTRTHRTPSGGWHHILSIPRAVTLRSSQARMRGLDLPAPGVDVVAGSAVIRWALRGYTVETDGDCEPLPCAWIDALSEPPLRAPVRPRGVRVRAHDRIRRYVLAALERESGELASLGAGRSSSLARAAYALGGLPALDHDEIVVALLEACLANGSIEKRGRRECERTIRRSAAAGAKYPRTVEART